MPSRLPPASITINDYLFGTLNPTTSFRRTQVVGPRPHSAYPYHILGRSFPKWQLSFPQSEYGLRSRFAHLTSAHAGGLVGVYQTWYDIFGDLIIMITYYSVFSHFGELICFFKLEDAIEFVNSLEGMFTWVDIKHIWL